MRKYPRLYKYYFQQPPATSGATYIRVDEVKRNDGGNYYVLYSISFDKGKIWKNSYALWPNGMPMKKFLRAVHYNKTCKQIRMNLKTNEFCGFDFLDELAML